MQRSLCLLVFLVAVQARSTTLNFEGFADSTIITTQYASQGATFGNSIILTSGESLNEFEFPPHSGVNVVSDNGGPVNINFSTPVTSVSGYFTYAQPLDLVGYDASNNVVANQMSSYSNNEALSGNAGSGPNELLTLTSNSGITSVMIEGSTTGSSFTLDDLSFSPKVVPEIDAGSCASAVALLVGVLMIFRGKRKKIGS